MYKFCPHLASWFLHAGHCEPLSSPSAPKIFIFSSSIIDALVCRYANTSRATHSHWLTLCIWSLSRAGTPPPQGEFELEMPWGQTLGQCNWELAMPLLLCPWTVGWAYALRCSTPEGLWWQVRPWGLLRSLQADLMGRENSENKMRPVVTVREFFCIDMYPGISLWSRKLFRLAGHKRKNGEQS